VTVSETTGVMTLIADNIVLVQTIAMRVVRIAGCVGSGRATGAERRMSASIRCSLVASVSTVKRLLLPLLLPS
jgi:hypothetical protein